MTESYFVGTIALIKGISVSFDVLGKEFGFKMCGLDGILCVPKVPLEYTNEDYRRYLLVKPEKGINTKVERLVSDWKWGEFFSDKGDATIYGCCVRFEVDKSQVSNELYNILNKALEEWIQLFKVNLSILSGQDLDEPKSLGHTTIIPKSEISCLYYGDGKTIKELGVTSTSERIIMGLFNATKHNTVNPDQIKEALSLTSSLKGPSLELYLFKEATYFLRRGDYRRCVLDCATVVEIILRKMIRQKLNNSGMDEVAINKILNSCDSIQRKRDYLKKQLGIKLPAVNYKDHVQVLRNRTIHAGYQPEANETRECKKITEQLINFAILDAFEPHTSKLLSKF